MTWFPKKKVVVPIDFSDESIAAVDVGLQLVEDPARVAVIHVLQDLSATEPGEIWRTIDADSRRRHARQWLDERLSDARFAAVQREILFGDPGHEVAAFAQQVDADLIVLPSHGRTGLRRLLIGSVAERVVRLAHCPVLVLRS